MKQYNIEKSFEVGVVNLRRDYKLLERKKALGRMAILEKSFRHSAPRKTTWPKP